VIPKHVAADAEGRDDTNAGNRDPHADVRSRLVATASYNTFVARLLAWLGGVAFVLSLSYLVYFYAVPLRVTAAEGTPLVPGALVNVALFSAFAIHHSLLARTSAKIWVARVVSPSLERSLYVWVSSALLVALCRAWQSLPGLVYSVTGIWALPLYGVQAVGAFLTVRGASVIDPLELAGIRQATSTPEARGDVLRVDGPFRLVRHPIYFGWMLMVFGAPIMTVNRLLFATISSVYLILAIPWEERSLVAAHGERYRAYQRAVRWRVVPGIW
jgi:protein-S-isoprenylcysteine O-methyltransferase Ste14